MPDLFFKCPAPAPRRLQSAQTDDQIKALIVQLETAYIQIMTNSAVRVFVDQNGERLEFGTANADKLKAFIERLYAMLPGYSPDVTKPMRYLF